MAKAKVVRGKTPLFRVLVATVDDGDIEFLDCESFDAIGGFLIVRTPTKSYVFPAHRVRDAECDR